MSLIEKAHQAVMPHDVAHYAAHYVAHDVAHYAAHDVAHYAAHDANREMHKAIYRFWQAQIQVAKSTQQANTTSNTTTCIKLLWERRIENATRGFHNFSAGILRDYGSEYFEAVAQPEWFEFLDLRLVQQPQTK
jgi:predicted SprT family Zn-dependent metalloprotease